MVTVTVLALADIAWRLNDYHTELVTPIAITVLSVVIALLVSVGATFGGALVYEYGFNVETAGDHPVWHKSETDVFPGQHEEEELVVTKLQHLYRRAGSEPVAGQPDPPVPARRHPGPLRRRRHPRRDRQPHDLRQGHRGLRRLRRAVRGARRRRHAGDRRLLGPRHRRRRATRSALLRPDVRRQRRDRRVRLDRGRPGARPRHRRHHRRRPRPPRRASTSPTCS